MLKRPTGFLAWKEKGLVSLTERPSPPTKKLMGLEAFFRIKPATNPPQWKMESRDLVMGVEFVFP